MDVLDWVVAHWVTGVALIATIFLSYRYILRPISKVFRRDMTAPVTRRDLHELDLKLNEVIQSLAQAGLKNDEARSSQLNQVKEELTSLKKLHELDLKAADLASRASRISNPQTFDEEFPPGPTCELCEKTPTDSRVKIDGEWKSCCVRCYESKWSPDVCFGCGRKILIQDGEVTLCSLCRNGMSYAGGSSPDLPGVSLASIKPNLNAWDPEAPVLERKTENSHDRVYWCDHCAKLATVHLTEVINKKKTETHLCESHSQEKAEETKNVTVNEPCTNLSMTSGSSGGVIEVDLSQPEFGLEAMGKQAPEDIAMKWDNISDWLANAALVKGVRSYFDWTCPDCEAVWRFRAGLEAQCKVCVDE